MLRLLRRMIVCAVILVLGVLLHPLVPAEARAEVAKVWAGATARLAKLWTRVKPHVVAAPPEVGSEAQALVQELDRMAKAQADIVAAVKRLTQRLDQNQGGQPEPGGTPPEGKR